MQCFFILCGYESKMGACLTLNMLFSNRCRDTVAVRGILGICKLDRWMCEYYFKVMAREDKA